MNESLLHPLAQRMGVASPAIHRKAEELVRLLNVQGGSHLTLSTSARIVICLDMAASVTGTTVDKKLAAKLSGLTRPQYVALSQTVTRLLNVSPKVMVTDLCQVHSTTAASHLAQQTLTLYEEQNSNKEVDLSLPAYPTAAIQAACSVLKVKVNKQQLYESSSSKKKLYLRLVEAMTTLAQRIHSQQAGRSGCSKHSTTLVELVEKNLKQCSPKKRKKINSEDEGANKEDDFEDWKRKIISAATTLE